MGVISRHVRDKANQRVAEERTLELHVEGGALASAVTALFDQWNAAADAQFDAAQAQRSRLQRWAHSSDTPAARHFSLLERSDGLLVTFGVTASWVAERGLHPAAKGWAARVADRGASTERTRTVSVALMKWTVDDAGLIWNGSRYVALLDGLIARLNGRYLSAPVAEEDQRFIEYG